MSPFLLVPPVDRGSDASLAGSESEGARDSALPRGMIEHLFGKKRGHQRLSTVKRCGRLWGSRLGTGVSVPFFVGVLQGRKRGHGVLG